MALGLLRRVIGAKLFALATIFGTPSVWRRIFCQFLFSALRCLMAWFPVPTRPNFYGWLWPGFLAVIFFENLLGRQDFQFLTRTLQDNQANTFSTGK